MSHIMYVRSDTISANETNAHACTRALSTTKFLFVFTYKYGRTVTHFLDCHASNKNKVSKTVFLNEYLKITVLAGCKFI